MSDLLTLKEAGKILRVGYKVVYEMARKKRIPVIRVGSQYRIPKEALETWIMEQAEVKEGEA